METLASIWARDPGDLHDLAEKRHEPSAALESQCSFYGSPPAGLMWMEQISPHLQRNKQLQDALLQREEELVRLQEENNKLREFLNSSFVRNLEQKAKKLTAEGRRTLKRNLNNETFNHQQLSKRVCRNLTAEFCSESSTLSEPNLDLWVLRTLGLKDRDTIDTSNESSSDCSLRGLVYDAAFMSLSSPEDNLSSSFGSPVASSTPSSVHSFCQRSTHDYRFKEHQPDCGNPAESNQNCTRSADVTADRPTEHLEMIRSCNTSTAFEIHSIAATSRVQTLDSEKPPLFWSHSRTPLQDSVQFSPPAGRVHFPQMSTSNQPWTPGGQTPAESSQNCTRSADVTADRPTEHLEATRSCNTSTTFEIGSIAAASRVQTLDSQDSVQFSPPAGRVHFPQMLTSNQPWTPGSPMSPSAVPRSPAAPPTPCGRSDLAFSMLLSPSSSVKTHSFPQGQAFVRKDTGGRWNFTWVPNQ
ncbi:geminin coiled-coil domain-containing protein 1 [Acanthochromis polyacanthus]|uniref:Geminin coiled-coil domain containing n=1 Tax=Acanthochromis polyacanthus TaxID=80966 RepID=A0A3Q1H608_9TELE|nr:geminin coiled-coil domain-containing protein 1 [Acanthochromis polyacanthus]